MSSLIKGTATSILLGIGLAGTADAAEILVTSNISTSTTWTADNTYNLQQQIYVLPGATLTIEPGTIIASTTNLGGSLAVTNGAQIHAEGTEDNPIIWTSKADVATWTGNPPDPKTGTWREGCNEWGNLTIMGDAYISENATVGNVPTPNPNNVAAMEGLVADFPGDTKVLYGGGNDDDDSGTVRYCSFRYGGKVISLANELNGLSLGGIGRGTDIHHVEVMNNVDDGVEIWGGTVNLKYINIWNVGDDSFDVDQGWRGKAQFIFIVQGYSCDAEQGSGVGDNCFETDGAEDSDWQPVTTAEADRLRDVEARSERSPLIFEVRRIPGAPEPDGDAGEQQGDDDGWPDDAAPATPPGAAKPEPEPPKPKPKRRSRSRAKPAAKK